jgi:hypothetical protein
MDMKTEIEEAMARQKHWTKKLWVVIVSLTVGFLIGAGIAQCRIDRSQSGLTIGELNVMIEEIESQPDPVIEPEPEPEPIPEPEVVYGLPDKLPDGRSSSIVTITDSDDEGGFWFDIGNQSYFYDAPTDRFFKWDDVLMDYERWRR